MPILDLLPMLYIVGLRGRYISTIIIIYIYIYININIYNIHLLVILIKPGRMKRPHRTPPGPSFPFFPLTSFDGVHNSAGNAWNQPPDFRDHLTAGGFSKWGGSPNGWFISWKFHLEMDDFGGTPILGNLQMIYIYI